MKNVLILALLTLLTLQAGAAQFVTLPNGLKLQLHSGNTSSVVRNAAPYSGDVVIPPTFSYNNVTYQVTAVYEEAFMNCSQLTSVTFPETLTKIGLRSFKNCTGLTSLTLPASLTTLQSEAFAGCTALASLNILSTLTSIDSKPFYGCKSLKEVTLNGESTGFLFYGCENIEKAVIGDHVKTIGDKSFYECENLTSLTMGKSVETIGAQAFANCVQLPSVVLPPSLTTIGDQAFLRCYSFTTINIPEGVTTIGGSAFAVCNNVTSVSIPRSLKTIGKGAFSNDEALTAVHITDLTAWCNIVFGDGGSNPLSNANHLFLNGSELTELAIPSGQTAVLDYTFQGGEAFTSVTIPNSVTTIGNNAFRECSGMTSVNIPNSVTTISDYAFSGCSSISEILIPEGVTTIGRMAFWKCSGMKSISMPSTLKSIADRAFEDCNSLKAVHITDVAAWCDVDFGESYSNPLQKARRLYMNKRPVNELKVPEGVKVIKPQAFAYCYTLESVVLPSTLEQIERDAFYDCPAMTEIICRAVEPPFIDYYSISKLGSKYLYVRESSIDAYKDSYWVQSKGILPLPDNLPAKCAKPTIAYVDGRFVFSSATDGVEFVSLIEDANAYPHQGSQYPLTSTYEVRVFCRLKGCDDSETTVATYTWDNGSPKITVIK